MSQSLLLALVGFAVWAGIVWLLWWYTLRLKREREDRERMRRHLAEEDIRRDAD